MKTIISDLISRLWILVIICILALSCSKEDPTSPELKTFIVKDIDSTSALTGGVIVNDGGSKIVSKGICWSKFPNPTIMESVSANIDGYDSIVVELTNLEIYATYYVRAYATNAKGTSYGNETSFTTQGGTMTDSEGNVYKTISI